MKYAIRLLVVTLAMACTRTSGEPSNAAVSRQRAEVVPADFSVFDLTSAWKDQQARSVELHDVGGKVSVLSMIYTNCTVTCPLIVADLKHIDAALQPGERDAVRFILVSLDPARDTPGRMAEWASGSRLDGRRWTLLSGSDGAVRELAATLDVRYQRQPDGEMAHTNGIHILDEQGHVAFRQTGLGGVEQTVQAIRSLLH